MNETNHIYDDDADNDEEILHGDDGTTLVIRKKLLTPKGDSEKDCSCINIFHSSCTIKKNVCNLIINSVTKIM